MLNRLKSLWQLIDAVRPQMGVLRQLFDLVRHKVLINTDPRDYFKFKFYESDLKLTDRARYVGMSGSMYYPFELNPLQFNILFTDKYVQKALLKGLDLPTPQMLTTIGINHPVSTIEKLKDFICSSSAEVVVKLISGSGGKGLMRLRIEGGVVYESDQIVSLEKLWARCAPNMNRGLIVETAVTASDTINQFNPTSLNTFRVITIKTSGNRWKLVCTYLKVGRQGSCVDNSKSGGLLVRVDETGRTGTALDITGEIGELTVHPDSGTQLAGVLIKGISDVIELALKASQGLSFAGFLGLDIALTDNGPTIIEVNARPSVDYPQLAYGAMITDEMAVILQKRNMFTFWDRSRMYPGFDRKNWHDFQ